MKDFFSEYGWLIIAGAIIILVLMFTTPFGQAITQSIAKFVTDFAAKVNTGISNWQPADSLTFNPSSIG